MTVPTYTTQPTDKAEVDGKPFTDAYEIVLEGDTTIEEALTDLGWELTDKPGAADPGQAMLGPDDVTVIVRSDFAMSPAAEGFVQELYSTPIDGKTFRKLERIPVPAGV